MYALITTTSITTTPMIQISAEQLFQHNQTLSAEIQQRNNDLAQAMIQINDLTRKK